MVEVKKVFAGLAQGGFLPHLLWVPQASVPGLSERLEVK